MGDAPSGTITLLFSDIEGSTLLLSRLGDGYVDALDGYRLVLRSAWSRWGGREMGTEGDSFFVVFKAARDAMNAALDAQRELAGHPWPGGVRLRVRMGLHTGKPALHDGGYVGMDVHRAARIAACAHGGQVVLTDATRHVLGDRLQEGARLLDLGWHRLRDLPQPEHLFQLSAEGLDEVFPPVKSLGTAASLPAQPDRLVGRNRELVELGGLVASPDVRLITLTGPGGSGKTRLASALAAAHVEAFPEGVYFVALAAVTVAEAMWRAIYDALSLTGAARTRERLLQQLAHRRLMLVLDNLEQLPQADAVVAELLATCPQLTVVATSRQPLHLRGEHEYAVPPLEVPLHDSLPDAETSAAVQLFCQHARMVRSTFTLTADNAKEVLAICRRLDGLPLAIELAASRTKVLSPSALLARLNTSWEPGGGGVDRPTRQRTLRDTIAWSYDLLSADQQAAFRRLGVFSGGCDLEAVAAVAADGGDPLDAVTDLVDVSLATIGEGPDGEPRVGLLQTVADFARDRLGESGELDEIRHRHAVHYLALAETLGPQLDTGLQLSAGERLETEHDNLRQALHWALHPEEPPPISAPREFVGLRLAAALWWFWSSRGHNSEGCRWLERAVALGGDSDSQARAGALHGLAIVTMLSRPTARRAWLEESLAIYGRLADSSSQAGVYISLGDWFWLEQDDGRETARQMFEKGIALADEVGDEARLAPALDALAHVEFEDGNVDRWIELMTAARELARRLGNERDVLGREQDLAWMLMRSGRLEDAHDKLQRIIPDVLRVRQPALTIYVVRTCAELFARLGDYERAARLSSAYEELYLAFGWPPKALRGAEESRLLEVVRDKLGDLAWVNANAIGHSYTGADALVEARRAPLSLSRRQ